MTRPWYFLRHLSQQAPVRTLVLLWLSLIVADLFWVRDLSWFLEQAQGKRFWVNFLISALVTWVLLYNLRGYWQRWRGLAAFLLVLIATAYFAQSAYFGIYRKFITLFDFRFFAADPWMSVELWWQHGEKLRPVLLALFATLVFWLAMQIERPGRRWLRWSKGTLGGLLFLLVTLNWYGSAHFQMAPIAYSGTLIAAVEFQHNRGDYPTKPTLPRQAPDPHKPNLVFVIGESLNIGHMGIYGYARDTTPQLSAMAAAGEVFALRNALSVSPRTLTSVPYMLTGLQGIDPHGVIYSVPTLFNYAKSAGYQTALITAQDFQWRDIDKLFVDQDLDHFEQGVDFSADVSVSIGADDHRVLHNGILPFIDRTEPLEAPYLLVTQMSGSHTPFSRQVPQELKQFLPEENPNSINAYDNTVWYSDLYLSQLVRHIRRQDPDAWIFYSSDHGEHVTGKGGMFHGDFNDEVIHNALLVFPPEGAQALIAQQLDAPVSQVDIFATLLELMAVEPVLEIDGLSLLQPIPAERLRIATAMMKTLHNDPRAALVFPDKSMLEIDFERMSAKLNNGDVVRYEALPAEWRALFDRRLEPQS
ncbi:phosphoethanolamine transferase [Nitrincola tapanii]|uniref:Phosphoethanolamine transferase n=1 Tax=Nitrincola tapanii TaxID=1708751 RepID=A0A5A9W4T0_9GAMM|nr:phosphoethanolamine transferase [Nitrincola tapanii]KAA0875088.1 phosphoethanolamine transferase [Nitrincola tapanii]